MDINGLSNGLFYLYINDWALCPGMKWCHKGFHGAATFTANEIDYIIDRWSQKGIDTSSVKIIDVNTGRIVD